MLAVWYVRCMYVFFFKQKTAYEMRISDWSSDVCSSDLQKWKSGSPGWPIGHLQMRSFRSSNVVLPAISGLGRAGTSRRVLVANGRSEEHTSELQSLMRISYAVFCLEKNITHIARTPY